MTLGLLLAAGQPLSGTSSSGRFESGQRPASSRTVRPGASAHAGGPHHPDRSASGARLGVVVKQEPYVRTVLVLDSEELRAP